MGINIWGKEINSCDDCNNFVGYTFSEENNQFAGCLYDKTINKIPYNEYNYGEIYPTCPFGKEVYDKDIEDLGWNNCGTEHTSIGITTRFEKGKVFIHYDSARNVLLIEGKVKLQIHNLEHLKFIFSLML
jgi:hypothetical protein